MDQVENDQLLQIETRALEIGALAGLVAGIGMGVVLQLGTDLLSLLGAFAGETSVLRGWLIHLLIAVAYGALFAVIVAYPAIRSMLDSTGPGEYALVGIVYATMIAAVSIAILPFVFQLPWAASVAEAGVENVPSTQAGLVPSAVFGVAHLIYGAILGAVYALVGEPEE